MPDIWAVTAILVKLLLYICILWGSGLAIMRVIFSDLVSPLASLMTWHMLFWAGGILLTSGLGFMLRGAALTGSADGMIDPEMLGLLWQTSAGDALLYRCIGAVVLIIGTMLPLGGAWVSLFGGLLTIWSFGLIGHVPELGGGAARVLLFLHLLGIAFWVGILGPLRRLAQQSLHHQRSARLGHRFGQVAAVIVPALILAGLLMAWIVLGEISALFTTGYGQTLVAKMLLVAALLTLAAVNKLRFVPAMLAGDKQAVGHLTRSIEIETWIILTVLAATAMLTSVLALPN
ncbi:Putative copper export protein [Roseobacter sp. SK209-2-6]|uniref:copper resistance D family protein n=1 Tax=Roseobacter sp. SK209-2-6 TaxID=388739 RepID=UPI0000F3D4FC|nr:CopD family protein [Roseobacter sp. SK209-2-6]EBA15758.1 Putative copper export protein [Roseobacter sp. SK209-2-6]